MMFKYLCHMWKNYLITEFSQVNDVIVEVVEGDARNVLCDTVEKYRASILVVGSHGYGAIKRYGFIVVTIIILRLE
jgi:nucleotide-binding universal stress UspA family protein